MSIDKKGFKYRLSNVLAWLGFSVTALNILYNTSDMDFDDGLWLALGFQGFLGIINYLMVGSFRLLPWRKFDE